MLHDLLKKKKKNRYLPIVRPPRISQHKRDNQCHKHGMPYSTISVVSYKSRIHVTISSNLSSSSSNLALFGTAIRLSEQTNRSPRLYRMREEKTRVLKKKAESAH